MKKKIEEEKEGGIDGEEELKVYGRGEGNGNDEI